MTWDTLAGTVLLTSMSVLPIRALVINVWMLLLLIPAFATTALPARIATRRSTNAPRIRVCLEYARIRLTPITAHVISVTLAVPAQSMLMTVILVPVITEDASTTSIPIHATATMAILVANVRRKLMSAAPFHVPVANAWTLLACFHAHVSPVTRETTVPLILMNAVRIHVYMARVPTKLLIISAHAVKDMEALNAIR